MSRNSTWDYQFDYGQISDDHDWAEWDCIINRAVAVVGDHAFEGAGSIGSQVSLWIWCNRAKAQRLAARLDREFDTVGIVEQLT